MELNFGTNLPMIPYKKPPPKPLPRPPVQLPTAMKPKPKRVLTAEQKNKMKMARQRNDQLRAAGMLPPRRRKGDPIMTVPKERKKRITQNTAIREAINSNKHYVTEARAAYRDPKKSYDEVAWFTSKVLNNLSELYSDHYIEFEAADPKFKKKFISLMQHIDTVLRNDIKDWKNY